MLNLGPDDAETNMMQRSNDLDTIQRVQDKSESKMCISKSHSRAAYAYATVQNAQGKILKTKVLIDSGNLISTGVAINEKFHKQLGVGYYRQNIGKVGTAGKGTCMTKLGRSNKFCLKIQGIKQTFTVCKATVIRNLIDEINLGTGFLQTVEKSTGHKPLIQFHGHGTTFICGKDSIELLEKIYQDKGKSSSRGSMGKRVGPESGHTDGSTGPKHGAPAADPDRVDMSHGVSIDRKRANSALPRGGTLPRKANNLTAAVSRNFPRKAPRDGLITAQKESSQHCCCHTNLTSEPIPRKLCKVGHPKDKGVTGLPGNRDSSLQSKSGNSPQLTEARIDPAEVDHKASRSPRGKVCQPHGQDEQIIICPLLNKENTCLQPNSLNFVSSTHIPATALIEAVELSNPSCKLLPAVYRNTGKVGILNLTDKPICLKAGTHIGDIYPLVLAKKEKSHCQADGDETRVNNLKNHDEEEEEIEKLFQDLKLYDNKMLREHPGMLEKTKELIRRHKEVFSSPDQVIGKTDLIEFDIKIKPGTKPKKARLRPLNPKQKKSLQDQIDLWKKEDVIEETESPWSSALVPALKKGGEIRWAVDYRPLNMDTVADSYPLPNISENLDTLQGSRVYSTLDASAAYNTIPVTEEAKSMLAFVTPFGLYTFKRMPFGAKNAGATYSRFIDMLITRLRSPYLLAYVDDVICHTPDIETHLAELDRAFTMHKEAGIRLAPHKTYLFQEEVDYLGYKVNVHGIHMKDSYVSRILDWPAPKTIKELNSLLGFMGYYRSFIPNYSQLTAEMNSQKKKKQLEWNAECQTNFDILKGLFGTKPIRSYPLFGEDQEMFTVNPDWCIEAIGVVLEQEQDGQVRFIAAAGRKTTPGERNYPPTKGELSAIIYALRKFEHILRYKKFVIYCDHMPLQWLKTMKNPKGIYWRWLQELETYDYEIRYKPGKKIGAADGLSRSPHMRMPTKEEIAESEEFVGLVTSDHDDVDGVTLDRVNIKLAQEKDEVLQEVTKWVKGNPPKSREQIRGLPEDCHTYHKLLKVLDIDEGGLLIRKPADENSTYGDRILIPKSEQLRQEVYRWSHEHPSAGHFGINSTYLRATQKFYWPSMHEFLRRRVRQCDVCLAKIQKTSLHATRHQPRRHGYPGEVVYVDLVGPLPETDKGDKYIVTMQDGFSKFVGASTIPNKEAITVANAVVDNWITKYGCPSRIHTDQGREFVNKIWTQLMDRLQITKTETPAYSPQGNLVERFHRSLNQIFRVYMNRDDKSWDRFIPMATLAYNTKVNATTGVTPFEAWMGRAPRLPIDVIIPTPEKRYSTEDQYIQDTMRRFEVMFSKMKENAETTFRRNARLYSGRPNEYAIGDLVWCFSKRKVKGKPGKITDSWMGPYKVIGKPADVLLQLKPADYQGKAITVHITTVRRFQGPKGGTDKYRPPHDPIEEEDGDELAEELGRPPRLIEPPDGIHVPIQVPNEEPEMMQDIQRPVNTNSQSTDTQDVQMHELPVKPKLVSRSNQTAKPIIKYDKRRRQAMTSDSDDPSSTAKPSRRKKLMSSDAIASRTRSGRWKDYAHDTDEASGVSKNPVDERLPSGDNSMESVSRTFPENVLSGNTSEDIDDIVAKLDNSISVSIPIGTKPPTRANESRTTWYLQANQSLTIQPNKSAQIDTGLRIAAPDGHALLLLSRPRLASQGIHLATEVIDSDYTGPIIITLHNSTNTPRRVCKGERLSIAVVIATPSIHWESAEFE